MHPRHIGRAQSHSPLVVTRSIHRVSQARHLSSRIPRAAVDYSTTARRRTLRPTTLRTSRVIVPPARTEPQVPMGDAAPTSRGRPTREQSFPIQGKQHTAHKRRSFVRNEPSKRTPRQQSPARHASLASTRHRRSLATGRRQPSGAPRRRTRPSMLATPQHSSRCLSTIVSSSHLARQRGVQSSCLGV